jgi:hypothetical protein
MTKRKQRDQLEEELDGDAYAAAYWRTIAYDTGAELTPDIDPDGPHVDYAGGVVVNPTRAAGEVTPT